MKIGLLFGSFNPPHYGHIALGEMMKEKVDEVWFVPAMQNPGKKEKAVDINLRIEMLKTLGLKVSEVEKEMGNFPHYTYDVLMEIQKRYPDVTFSLICGEDIDPGRYWRNGKKIVEGFEIIRVPRMMGISSTQLRSLIKEGKSLEGLCPPEIEKIIQENNLYSL